ncbi:glutathione S-transferase F13 [Benincasa hispida]|uniref:glutathione S-transferase F13 n=1 Tax=Benincasa hispida TaxID=102211 RepID=UPI0018FFAE8C|nr:glutathione S-transferase F13 [Benincasa hispida]
MAVKVYGLPISTCTLTVMICLHEKQLHFQFLHVDLFNGEHKQPPFLAINPFGQIPALEDGDVTLFESRAITSYIANKHKETGPDLLLQHQSPKEEAIVKQWMEVESHHYSSAITPIIHEFFTAHLRGHEPDQCLINQNLERLGTVLDVYEQRLGGTKYLAGPWYTLADLHHLPCTFYFMKTPWASMVNDRPNVKAWWDDISSRPAFLKVIEGMSTFDFGGDDKK